MGFTTFIDADIFSKVEGKYAAIVIKRLAEIIQKFIELEEKEKLLMNV